MTPHDTRPERPRSGRSMRLASSVHLRTEPDGGARVVDDRTFTAAHVNKTARILLEALHEPRTEQDLVTVLADAADCHTGDAIAPVARLVDELTALGWIESSDTPTAPHPSS